MCRDYTHDSLIPVLSSDTFPNRVWGKRKSKTNCENIFTFRHSKLSKQSQSRKSSETMALSGKSSGRSLSGVGSSAPDICPCCRSDSDCKGNFMCSQLSRYQKLSRDAHGPQTVSHLHTQCNSQLQKFCSGGAPFLGHVPSDLCRCAKTVTNSRNNPNTTTRASHCSSTDGWRAFRLVLVGILVVLPTPTMSNPINHSQRSGSPHSSGHRSHHHSPHRGNEREMKWINPCRIPASIPTQPTEIHMQSQSDEEIFQNIVTQARKAEVQARRFFDDFKREAFGNEHHNFGPLHYDWLKDIADAVGKNLGEPVSQSRLETLEVEDILKSMYRGLQKLAVGLEQVVLDQSIHDGSFYQHFHEAEFQLKYVLCEFQIAMMEKNIKYEDVTREIMDRENFADIPDRTVRNFRDFTIFRDYLNTLEFIQFSFEHFRNQAKTS